MHLYMYLTIKILIPYFVAFFVLSGIVLFVLNFQFLGREISANGRDAIVFLISSYSE